MTLQTYYVTIDGDQTIRNIQPTCDRLKAAIDEHHSIVVVCSGVFELDLSLLQVLLAAKRSADMNGKSLRLEQSTNEKLRSALDLAGFLRAGNGDPAPAAGFWLEGTKVA